MASTKKSSTEIKSKEAGTSKPATKITKTLNARKSDKNDSKKKKKKIYSNKHSNNGSVKEGDAVFISAPGSASEEEDAGEDRAETTSKKAKTSKSKRIKKITRDENSDFRINQEALFLVNKATEMFLLQFCKDAYACCARDRKQSLAYKHLSSVVSKRKRYDFLSDFVPEKLKFEDASKEIDMAESGKGEAS
ncbi:Chromatin accessibility complex 16kD protein, partial [Cucurbita argyrosperma subsp. sororia]